LTADQWHDLISIVRVCPADQQNPPAKENVMTRSVGILCFSPTNTTRRICDAVAVGMGSEKPKVLDATLPDTRAGIIANPGTALNGIDHLIVGAPVYGGRLPVQAMQCLRSLGGTGKECTAVVVYGNRDYGVALHQMVEVLSKNAFAVAAAGLFIGEHSYSELIPVAVGRPDKSDLEKAADFGSKVLSSSRHLTVNDVPNHPDIYSKFPDSRVLKASYDERLCAQCPKCAKVCPLGLISSDTGGFVSEAAKKECLGCMACVRSCKLKARATKASPVTKLFLTRILGQASRERQEPVVIL
jgi:Pyruvate/2-oxoacid:ferredoxin oxidoreductase delta subunit